MSNKSEKTEQVMKQTMLPLNTEGEDFITIKELCAKLKVSRSLIYTLINNKKLPKHKIGRALRFKFSEVSEHLETLNE